MGFIPEKTLKGRLNDLKFGSHLNFDGHCVSGLKDFLGRIDKVAHKVWVFRVFSFGLILEQVVTAKTDEHFLDGVVHRPTQVAQTWVNRYDDHIAFNGEHIYVFDTIRKHYKGPVFESKMNVVKNPAWFDSPEMNTWLSDTQFPLSEHAMLQYIRAKWPEALQRRVVLDKSIPQSYAHWWVKCRVQYTQEQKPTPMYVLIEFWRPVASAWLDTVSDSDEDILAMFRTWLDLLFVDITTFDDEHHRDGVPRLYPDGTVICKKRPGSKKATRRATVDFIVQQGRQIFEERGFTEGLAWWNDECKLVNSL